MTNPNETHTFGLSRAELDAWFDRSNAQAVANAADRKRLAEWPGAIEQALLALLARIERLEARDGRN